MQIPRHPSFPVISQLSTASICYFESFHKADQCTVHSDALGYCTCHKSTSTPRLFPRGGSLKSFPYQSRLSTPGSHHFMHLEDMVSNPANSTLVMFERCRMSSTTWPMSITNQPRRLKRERVPQTCMVPVHMPLPFQAASIQGSMTL